MENFIKLKTSGNKKMNSNKYAEAIKDFTQVIDNLNPTNNEEAILKGVCLLNRSSCNLMLNNEEAATTDANTVIALYQSLRSEEEQKAMSPEQMRADPLTDLLCRAYVRRGEACESQLQLLEAFHEYSKANMLNPCEEVQKSLKSLLRKLNIPEFNQKDPDLHFFALLLLHLLNESDLIASLTDLIQYLKESQMSEATKKRIDDSKCTNILFVLMQLYSQNEIIVISSIIAARLFTEKGIASIWNGILVLKQVIMEWEKNEKICGECLRFIYLTPPPLYQLLIEDDFFVQIADCLALNLQPEEFEFGCFILYQLLVKPSIIGYIINSTNVIPQILSHKTKGSLMLMSKLSIDGDVLFENSSEMGISWVLDLVKDNPDNTEVIYGGAILISKIILYFDDKEPASSDDPTELPHSLTDDEIRSLFDVFSSAALKYSRNPDVVSALFGLFALAVSIEASHQKIKDSNLIRAGSAILAIHLKTNIKVAQNIIAFFYESAISGLAEEISKVKPVIPTVIRAMQQFPTFQPIVERTVALATIFEYPDAEKLMDNALKQFPNSSFLHKFLQSRQPAKEEGK